ncbi:hypothetical protein M3Y99_00938000 [Aphelenchoides fujianensis]|nr:hypothetical protein M3Y99_00938000 [Aphelenchoides fujianensis]
MSTARAFRPQGRALPRPAGQQGPRLHRNPAIPGGGKRGRFGPSKVLTGMWAMTVEEFREHVRNSKAENPPAPGDIVVTLDGLPAADFFQLAEMKERCPAGIHAGNIVQEIIAALKSGDKQHQDAILAFIFEHPAEAQQAAQSAEVATLAAVQPELAAQITTILAMKKPAV